MPQFLIDSNLPYYFHFGAVRNIFINMILARRGQTMKSGNMPR
jgi:hypothetical protein